MGDEDAKDDEEDEIPRQSQDASFLRRMAGPSVNKAGLAKDQTEINKIIAEVSKNTKFYENEKRRDSDWTKRIDKILERKNELLRESNIPSVERKVDKILAEMEANRDLSQVIVHLDMDAFFANVETLHNPDLAGKPFAVVGLGIVTTASYDARKFGVRSAMPEFIAKKLCPELLLVPVDYHRVGEMSGKVMKICKEYDPNMYIASCDEGFLNITPYLEEHNLEPEECVRQMRERIHAETKLTASAGIAPCMVLAKICSDRNKPNGQYYMPFERDVIMQFMHDLPVRKVPGIGRVGERVLEAIGVKTCGDIFAQRAIIWLMPRKFAVNFLFETYLGISSNKVQPSQREERKSVGASRTFRPVHTEEAIYEKLEYIASLLERDLQTEGWTGKTVILTVKLDTFKVFTRMKSFEKWIHTKEDLFNVGKELLKPELPLRVRLLGLRVTNLIDLRAPADQGIKRYFEPEAQSPRKRQKLDTDKIAGPSRPLVKSRSSTPAIVDLTNFDDGDEALVGEANDKEDELDDDDEETARIQALAQAKEDVPSFRYKKPPSKASASKLIRTRSKPSSSKSEAGPSRPISAGKKPMSSSTKPISKLPIPPKPTSKKSPKPFLKPLSKQTKSSPEPRRITETHTCPVCSREFELDNFGFNEHLDFCLSKSAILEATSPGTGMGRSKKNTD